MENRLTLTNLLVAVGVLLFLFALLTPALPVARETPRANTCRNNLTNLVKSLINYESTHRRYPDYQQVMITRSGHAMQMNWLAEIMRQLDRPDIDNTLRSFKPPTPIPLDSATRDSLAMNPFTVGAGPDPPLRASFLEILLCLASDLPKSPPVTNYIINTGRLDNPTGLADGFPVDYPDNGVFQTSQILQTPSGFYRLGALGQSMSSDFIQRHDGLSTTLMLSERIDAGLWTDIDELKLGFVWQPAVDPLPTAPRDYTMCRPNGKPLLAPANADSRWSRPSSHHPGGFNVAFAGGNVRFIDEQIDYHVWILLMTSNGAGAREPGTDTRTVLIGAKPKQTPGSELNERDIIP
jgi:prepilin-type processing-associated H-X9-DG protein